MYRQRTTIRHSEGGVAAILLLFALSAFSVLGVAALSTTLGSAPAGRTFSIFRTIPRDALTHFIATMVVPNDWLTSGAQGSVQFQLPVVVPQTGGDESGSISAWHPMTEVPGMAVCCESRLGTCSVQRAAAGEPPLEDWNPGTDDALRLAFDLASQPNADATTGDTVTATVTSVAPAVTEGSLLSCQLVFDGQVIAKGTALLRQVPRQASSSLETEQVVGSMTLAVRTR